MQASMKAAELPLVLTVSDIQRMLGISRVTAYELVHRQDFPIVRIGRVIRVPRDAFLRWLETQAGVGV
jgi:excisionase family DNA binding protein